MNQEVLDKTIVEIQPNPDAKSIKDIAARLTSKVDRIFKIELAKQYVPSSPGDWQGIELLKWMRILGINNHCVLLSDNSFEVLCRLDPQNEILIKKGNTLVKNGCETTGDFSEKADPTEMRKYFRGRIDLVLEKHIAANRFGLERIQHLHMNNDRSFRPTNSSQPPDLRYEAMKFAYDVAPLTSLNNLGDAPTLLKSLRDECDAKKPTVVLVDDMADEGWAELFTSILGNGCNFHSIGSREISSNPTPEKLAALIKSKGIDVKQPHLLILDLRLLGEEETTNRNDGKPLDDYKTLLSFQTLKALNFRKKGDLRFKVMFSTASHDQSKLKGMRKSRVFSPHGIFTKESIDAQLSAKASLENYCDLLQMLKEIISKKSADILVDSPELVHPDIEEERKSLVTSLNATWNSWKQARESTAVNWVNELYLDTNVFLDVDDLTSLVGLLRNSSKRIQIPKTVLYELQVIAEDSGIAYGAKDVVAAFFVKKIVDLKLHISEEGMTQNQRNIINSGQHHTSDFADKQILSIMLNQCGQRLIISRDSQLLKDILSKSNGRSKTRFGIPSQVAKSSSRQFNKRFRR
jgi:uncharacterized protein with PIN domain